jgi:tetratricopeptide (TPR) repeat protein
MTSGRAKGERAVLACLALGVLGALTTGTALAAPAELEFARGVVAFSQGELDEAARRFEAVLVQEPENLQARAYLGQVALGRGEVAEAVELLAAVLERAPELASVRLDLALALVRAGRLEQAEVELARTAEALDENGAVHFYLGTCRYRLGRFHEALPPLARAQALDQGFAAAAGYYLALTLYRLGERAEAERQFRELVGRSEAGWVATQARENLSAMAGAERQRWGLFVSAGFQYDSNVTLDRARASEADSPGLFLAAGVFGLPLLAERDALELGASLFRTFHLTGEAGRYDLTDVSALARYRRIFESGHQLHLGYLMDLDMLDDLGVAVPTSTGFGLFMHGHAAELGARFQWSRWIWTGLAYRFRAEFFADDGRTNLGHELRLHQELSWLEGRLRLAGALSGFHEDGRTADWNLWGLLAELELRGEPLDWLGLWARAGWRREDHYTFASLAGGRVDDLVTAGLGVNFKVWDHLSLGLSYALMDNLSSQEPYSYQRHVLSAVVTGSL